MIVKNISQNDSIYKRILFELWIVILYKKVRQNNPIKRSHKSQSTDIWR